MIGTTNLKEGCLLISYLAYPKNDDGDLLIPDDSVLKEALLHYILYRYWMSKDLISGGSANNARARSQEAYQMYTTLAGKAAGRLNMPTLDQLENIRLQSTRLIPRSNRYESFFMNLANPESIRF